MIHKNEDQENWIPFVDKISRENIEESTSKHWLEIFVIRFHQAYNESKKNNLYEAKYYLACAIEAWNRAVKPLQDKLPEIGN